MEINLFFYLKFQKTKKYRDGIRKSLMASLIIGYSVQGKKIKYLKDKSIILDNKNKLSDFNSISQINLKKITHAYVCTPESYKFFYIKKLLQNNIKVLIEKPLSLTKKQFREISSLIKKIVFVYIRLIIIDLNLI